MDSSTRRAMCPVAEATLSFRSRPSQTWVESIQLCFDLFGGTLVDNLPAHDFARVAKPVARRSEIALDAMNTCAEYHLDQTGLLAKHGHFGGIAIGGHGDGDCFRARAVAHVEIPYLSDWPQVYNVLDVKVGDEFIGPSFMQATA